MELSRAALVVAIVAGFAGVLLFSPYEAFLEGVLALAIIVAAVVGDVASAQSPGLAGDHGGGDLSARENVGGAEFDLGPSGGELVNGNECVGGRSRVFRGEWPREVQLFELGFFITICAHRDSILPVSAPSRLCLAGGLD